MEDRYAGVMLRNTMRRPLVFCVAGKTVRLAPGERMEVPGSWLDGTELQVLRTSGLVRMEGAPETRTGKEEPGKGPKGTKKSKPKTSKSEE